MTYAEMRIQGRRHKVGFEECRNDEHKLIWSVTNMHLALEFNLLERPRLAILGCLGLKMPREQNERETKGKHREPSHG